MNNLDMNNMYINELLKWFALGAIAAAGYALLSVAVGFVKAWITDSYEQAAALDEINNMTYFPRVRVYPELVKRFTAIHNARILDMLDLGVEPESGNHFYYLHVTQPGRFCSDMLIGVGENRINLYHYEENKVASALIHKCNLYVHDTALDKMVIMFATRIMNSDTAPSSRYSSTTFDSEGRIVYDKTSDTSESEG